MEQPRIKVPAQVKAGAAFQVKVLASHPMESGQRDDPATGGKLPRKILNAFVCTFDGAEILRVELHPAVSANPYLSFFATAENSGEMRFEWTDDDGAVTVSTARIEVVQ